MSMSHVAANCVAENRRFPLPSGVGILLVGHGTRDAVGQHEFLMTAAMLQQALGETPVEPCFLELVEPGIPLGWRRLAERGVRHVVVTPLLLFAAGHAKCDIPDATAAAADRTPGITWSKSAPLGCHQAVLELSARRFDEADPLGNEELAQTLLLMVGRGSLDVEATAAMHAFAGLRQAQSRPAATQVAFIAMAEPRLPAALQDVGVQRFTRVIVQPHLLFSGLLLDEVRAQVATAARHMPETQWQVADRLGPDDLLIQAVLDRVVESICV